MNDKLVQIGRLSMRQEGDKWVAYYAMPNSMEKRVFLGSIAMGAVATNQERKRAFMGMMRDIVADIIEAETGTRPTWLGTQAAPEHERSGNA